MRPVPAPAPYRPRLRRSGRAQRRQGFSLIEVMMVIAIIGVLTAIGYGLAQDLIPQYRTRQAAMEFSNAVSNCRNLAVQSGQRCRVQLLVADPDLDDLSNNIGRYQVDVEMGPGLGWDVLPMDSEADNTDDDQSAGLVDLDRSAVNGLRHVAIADWGSIVGPGSGNADSLVFDTRGFLLNPDDDFAADGSSDGQISITFVNKVAEAKGSPDRWSVRINRAGLTQLDSSRRASDNSSSGGGISASTTADTVTFGSP